MEIVYLALLWVLPFFFLWRIPRCAGASDPAAARGLSVIVPARNEEGRLGGLLRSLATQAPAPREVLVVDDGSSDRTAEVARAWGAAVVEAGPKPPGWAGKTWACRQGARRASGGILLFLDADTELEPGGLGRLAAAVPEDGFLSVQPWHAVRRPYEQLSAFFNLVTMAGMGAFTALGRRVRPAGGFGPCLAVRRGDYFRAGGHEAVRAEVLENLALCRRLSAAGLRPRLCGGAGTLRYRMYPGGLRELASGWSRSMAAGAGGISPLFLVLTAAWLTGATGAAVRVATSAGGPAGAALTAALALYLFYAGQSFWMLRRIGRFHPLTALFYPVPLLFFHLVFLRSLWLTVTGRRVSWRGGELRLGGGGGRQDGRGGGRGRRPMRGSRPPREGP